MVLNQRVSEKKYPPKIVANDLCMVGKLLCLVFCITFLQVKSGLKTLYIEFWMSWRLFVKFLRDDSS